MVQKIESLLQGFVTLDAVQTDANACQTQPFLAVAPFTTIRCNPMPSDSNSLTSSHLSHRIASSVTGMLSSRRLWEKSAAERLCGGSKGENNDGRKSENHDG